MIENLVGRTLAERYHVLELIGTGGMASVYKAQCELLKREVAIKVLRDSVKDDESALKSFKQEALAAAKLNHNNIVQIFDVGEVDGADYMVMELVDGVTLKKYIRDNGPLSCNEACEFAIQIAQALEAAHAKGVVHRDIKPQNILMTEDKILKVTDFGIAKAANTETLVAGDHGAMGSVHYISPEQARGGFTDARSDIYSLGVVLYEMLTGKVPFDGESAVAVALMHIEKQAPSVIDYNPSVPQDVAKIVAKAICKEQSSRYQTATEMIQDLQAVMSNIPVEVDIPEEDEDNNLGHTRKFRIHEDDLKQTKKTKKQKKQKTEEEKKADKRAVILAFLTVILIVVAAFGGYAYMMRNAGKIQVPDFTDMSLEDVSALAEEKGIIISDELEYALSDKIKEGNIISQNPDPKTYIDKEQMVYLVVSIGSSGGDIPVPYIKGMAVEDAINDIIDADLSYLISEEYSDTVPVGQVIRQSPEVGTKLNKDDIVTIHVSMGKTNPAETENPDELVLVPNFVGETQVGATQLCQQWKLNLVAIATKNSSQPAGTVISQSPAAGNQVRVGAGVSIVVSNGLGGENEFVGPTIMPSRTPIPDEGEDIEETYPLKTKEFTFQIPEDKESVDVKIVVDGDTQYEKKNNGGDIVSIDITGKGNIKVAVYFDGKMVKEETVNMD